MIYRVVSDIQPLTKCDKVKTEEPQLHALSRLTIKSVLHYVRSRLEETPQRTSAPNHAQTKKWTNTDLDVILIRSLPYIRVPR